MRFGDHFVFAFAPDFKIQSQRFRPSATDIDGDLQQVVQLRGAAKVAFEMSARQPHVQFVEHHAVGKTDGAEKLCFSKLEEANVSAIEDNARRVDIAPANALFDNVFQRLVDRFDSLEFV